MAQKNILITGTSGGLGQALAQHYLSRGDSVFGFSRRGAAFAHQNMRDAQIDMANLETLAASLDALLKGVKQIDLLVLNAGILGKIEAMHETTFKELKPLMDINVWSNKVLLDYICRSEIKVGQVMAVSSGAAVNGNKGWGAYSLSKATLNMLIKLYAAEYPEIHFISLAPGLVDTQMQDYLCDQSNVDEAAFPSVMKLRAARGTDAMPMPDVAARNIAAVLPQLKQQHESGAFVDMRKL